MSELKTPSRGDYFNSSNVNFSSMNLNSPEPTPKNDLRSALKRDFTKPKNNSIIPLDNKVERRTNHAPSDIPLTEIHASPTLQLLLYFNIFYSIGYFIFQIVLFIVSINNYSIVGLIVHIVLLIALLGCELLRLFAGFFGNLYERVPRLAAFLVITCMVSFPILLAYFVIGFKQITLLERSTSILLLIFIILEIIIGAIAMWRIVKIASRNYNLQFNEDGSTYQDLEEGNYYEVLQDEVELLERPATSMSENKETEMSRSHSRSVLNSPSYNRMDNLMLSPSQGGFGNVSRPTSPNFQLNQSLSRFEKNEINERSERIEKFESKQSYRSERNHYRVESLSELRGSDIRSNDIRGDMKAPEIRIRNELRGTEIRSLSDMRGLR